MEKAEERVEPAPLQVALLYKLLKVQRETLEFLKETTPEGVDFPIEEVTVTDVETIDFVKGYPYRPIRSIDPVFNKGPDTAYVRLNDTGKEFPVENRERITIKRPKATIRYLIIRVDPGNSATLRMWGHY